MKTTADFLDDLRAKYDLSSDYQLCKMLGMHRQQVSRYRLMKGAFDDVIAVKVAELLDLNPGYVMACMHAQRASEEHIKKAWERAAQVLGGIAAGVVIMTNPVMGFDAETASLLTLAAESSVLCILC